MVTDPHTHNTHTNTQTGAITIHCAAGSATSRRSACIVTSRRHDNRLTNVSLSFIAINHGGDKWRRRMSFDNPNLRHDTRECREPVLSWVTARAQPKVRRSSRQRSNALYRCLVLKDPQYPRLGAIRGKVGWYFFSIFDQHRLFPKCRWAHGYY